MTPNELLKSVKARFSVLLVDDDKQLTELLLSSLRKFRDKAGVRTSMQFDEAGTHELPENYLGISTIKDADQDAVFESPYLAGGRYWVALPSDVPYPITLSYFLDLVKTGLDDQLPEQCIDLTSMHLQVQIERVNDAQIKQIESLADGDVSDLSTPAEKDAALASIEEQMAMQMSFADILTVQP